MAARIKSARAPLPPRFEDLAARDDIRPYHSGAKARRLRAKIADFIAAHGGAKSLRRAERAR